ncbi:hypothetical protein VPH35_115332 [Triticum aestivum]
MEAKTSRAAAIAALCVLLLVLPGQVAAKSKFSPTRPPPAGGTDRDRCRETCAKVKICGQSDPSAGECDRGCY